MYIENLKLGEWSQLPSLNPLRAQHGCALVEYRGQKGVLIAGGDSGGTRSNIQYNTSIQSNILYAPRCSEYG